MASVLVVLVFVDSFLSGWLLAQVLGIKRTIAQLSEVQQSAMYQIGVMGNTAVPAEVVKDA